MEFLLVIAYGTIAYLAIASIFTKGLFSSPATRFATTMVISFWVSFVTTLQLSKYLKDIFS
jgi:hypothetical protein